MDLVRNENGVGKYIAIKVKCLDCVPNNAQELAEAILRHPESVVIGRPHTADEFFLISLKDIHADAALRAYAADVTEDADYAREVALLAQRAGIYSSFRKVPD